MITNGAPLALQDDAECAQIGTEFFFAEKGGPTRDAKKVCAQCPVIAECLDYAQQVEWEYGIFGGLTPTERRRVRLAVE